jgi:hypothetical protein
MKRGAHGEASIEQPGEHRWRLRYRIDGRRYTKSVQGTRKQAQAELRRLLRPRIPDLKPALRLQRDIDPRTPASPCRRRCASAQDGGSSVS